jgi:hypothetical protein
MTADDPFDLERFVATQAPVFETVLAELRAGRKRSHWMWFVFPQLADLGLSSTARSTASVPSMKRARIWPTPYWGRGSTFAPESCLRARVRPIQEHPSGGGREGDLVPALGFAGKPIVDRHGHLLAIKIDLERAIDRFADEGELYDARERGGPMFA